MNNRTSHMRLFTLLLSIISYIAVLSNSNADMIAPVAGDIAPIGTSDGTINVADLVVLQRFVTGEATPTAAEKILGDLAPLNNPDGVIDQADLTLMRKAVFGLTSMDYYAPQPVSKELITIDFDGVTATILGNALSAESNATVTITNTRTGESVNISTDANGVFGPLLIDALEGDNLDIIVTDSVGNSSIINSLIVLADPDQFGPYFVGTVEYLDENGITGITDPTGTTGPDYDVNLAWARIMYPATSAGTATPVHSAESAYPVVLFLHGNHMKCDDDGAGTGDTGSADHDCPPANRVPDFEGYTYLMEKLASQGIFTISISAHQLQQRSDAWNINARALLMLAHLDILKDWNDNGTDPFGGIFANRIDMNRIGISGHSRGGTAASMIETYNNIRTSPYTIVAINAIAPTGAIENQILYEVNDSSYMALLGSLDGDVINLAGFNVYEYAATDSAINRKPKAISFGYGANHNYYNTIWTDTAALGETNPWAGAQDDNYLLTNTPTVMSAHTQRLSAIYSIIPFFRWQLQGISEYKVAVTGEYRFAAAPNDLMFWTYQDADRLTVDNFEQLPYDTATNTLGSDVTQSGFNNFDECDYPGCFPIINPDEIAPAECGGTLNHIGSGLKLGEGSFGIYSTALPPDKQDVSSYEVLTLRAARRATVYPPVVTPGASAPLATLQINLEDINGNSALRNIHSSQYGSLPYPPDSIPADFYANLMKCTSYSYFVNRSQLSSIRIPLRDFTLNNSGIDLTQIVKITIRTGDTGIIAIDDIEFGR